MERTILHVDLNNFYASVECLLDPSLREKAVAVCGDAQARHGIVLAKNMRAKNSGVKTGYTIADAMRACPELVCVGANIEQYLKFSSLAKNIYYSYTDRVESYGIDECWLDITGEKDGRGVADEIRKRVKRELGITVSVGVSYNKIFAKLGSDYKKPDATTEIRVDNYKSLLWSLPVSDMLFVGSSTEKKLRMYGINTIGELACADERLISNLLGKNGRLLMLFANGEDRSRVCSGEDEAIIKSVGNSTTPPRDIVSDSDAASVILTLSKSVARRLREAELKCFTVQLELRSTSLHTVSRRVTLDHPTYLYDTIFKAAYDLFLQNHIKNVPIRSLGVRGCNLVVSHSLQISAFDDTEGEGKRERLERTVDSICSRFGSAAMVNGIMLEKRELTYGALNGTPVHPEPFYK